MAWTRTDGSYDRRGLLIDTAGHSLDHEQKENHRNTDPPMYVLNSESVGSAMIMLVVLLSQRYPALNGWTKQWAFVLSSECWTYRPLARLWYTSYKRATTHLEARSQYIFRSCLYDMNGSPLLRKYRSPARFVRRMCHHHGLAQDDSHHYMCIDSVYLKWAEAL